MPAAHREAVRGRRRLAGQVGAGWGFGETVSQREEGAAAGAGRGKGEPARDASLKPEFTADVTEVGSHASFVSKGVSAGRGSRLGWAEEERDAGELLLSVSAQIRDGSLICWTPWFRLINEINLRSHHQKPRFPMT